MDCFSIVVLIMHLQNQLWKIRNVRYVESGIRQHEICFLFSWFSFFYYRNTYKARYCTCICFGYGFSLTDLQRQLLK